VPERKLGNTQCAEATKKASKDTIMLTSAEQIQIFYEIAMSIGRSLDMSKMLKAGLSAYLKKLNCSAGGIFIFAKTSDRMFTFEHIYSIPRNADKNKIYQNAIHEIPKRLDGKNLSRFQQGLP